MIDLHTHSSCSDGILPPDAVVALAAKSGVDCLALTDHDTVDGLDLACSAAREHGIQLIPGIELSMNWNNRGIHVLGLNIDKKSSALQSVISKNLKFRVERAKKIALKLSKVGIKDAYQGAQLAAKGRMITRTHFARYLIEQKYAKNFSDVFKRYMVKGKPGYVHCEWVSLAEGLDAIIAAGGIAAIAHPLRYKCSATLLRRLCAEFKSLGGRALEVSWGGASPAMVQSASALAERYDLMVSKGSDFHDPENSWIKLGKMPDIATHLKPIWTSWTDSNY